MEVADIKSIAVLGGGSWGTTIANHLAKKGFAVTLWAREREVVDSITNQHENRLFHPGFELHPGLKSDHNLAAVAESAPLIVLAIPTQYIRNTLTPVIPKLKESLAIVSIVKGIESDSLLTVTALLRQLGKFSPKQLAVLSGPSFATEVIRGLPTALTLACSDTDQAKRLQTIFHTPYFRPYVSHDPLGVELGGAIKNVVAIGVGMIEGLNFGTNARAALITRALAEMIRLAVAMGAEAQTLSGLSGVGDLILTCTSTMSRNLSLGIRLGQGASLSILLKSSPMVVEGVETAKALHQLAERHKVETPITEQVYQVLHRGKDPKQAVNDLLSRELKTEFPELKT